MPDYELGCRRVIPTNSYLPALSRNNVDVDISEIENITATGIRTKDGKDIPWDIIVYATGFFAYSNMKKKMKLTVWQSGECSAFYRKDMTGEVTSLSPESVVNFIFSRKWFRLRDYHILR